MASKELHRLTPPAVMAARRDTPSDQLDDGQGLRLRFPRKGNGPPAFVFRYASPTDGRPREMSYGQAGQGSAEAAAATLTKARLEHAEARLALMKGKDPMAEREKADDEKQRERNEAKAKKAEKKAAAVTLRRFARQYHEDQVEPVRTPKHGKQWIASIELREDVKPRTPQQRRDRKLLDALLDRPIDSIEPLELLDALVPLCRSVPETGFRVYQRIALIFDAAILAKVCKLNPAAPIRKELARRVGRRERGNFAAMDWRKLPAFIERLREAQGTAARCLEWLVLTAARTSEALGAEWSEIDLERREWRVPAGRMKLREEHVVYLTDRALAILEAQRGQHDRYVFPSITGSGEPQSNMALAMCLRRLGEGEVTVHGFRSAFSTWAAETHAATPDVVECALAHKEQDRVRRAYMRGAFIEQRRQLMERWAEFLHGREPASNIIPLQRAA